MTDIVLEKAPLPRAPRPAVPPRVLGRLEGEPGSPTLLCLGSVHGNEPSGVLALRRVLAALEADPAGRVGGFVALAGNRRAIESGRRFVSSDLNRHWQLERVERLRAASLETLEGEDAELRELDALLLELAERSTGPNFAVDLHTTSGEGACFVVLDDSLANREFALDVPVTVVVGLEEELSGTVTSHMDSLGFQVFGFEAGQHDDPSSVDRAAAAVWIALEASGVLAVGSRPEVAAARDLLERASGDLPHVVEVTHRHPVRDCDDFRMLGGFVNFQPVAENQLLAHDCDGEVRTPRGGMILMPLYQRQGEDGFFIVQVVKPLWLAVSKALRNLDAQRILPILPGVRRHSERADTFVVDQKTARFLARELFHLLGYRRTGELQGRFLIMTRRHPHG
ncbi:MAG: succinylglutamate desuccinylase/aspartoacylase family protein [Acidobacteriota bacterium]